MLNKSEITRKDFLLKEYFRVDILLCHNHPNENDIINNIMFITSIEPSKIEEKFGKQNFVIRDYKTKKIWVFDFSNESFIIEANKEIGNVVKCTSKDIDKIKKFYKSIINKLA